MTSAEQSIVVVSPERGNRFYRSLAADIARSLTEAQVEPQLVDARALPALREDKLRQACVLLVNPIECALSGADVLRSAAAALRTVAVLSECVETRWYEKQFKLGFNFDAVFDVGFAPQRVRQSKNTEARYHFVFNGVRPGESFPLPGSQRPLRWVLVGHQTPSRAQLAAALIERVSPNGFLFLPPIRPPGRPGTDLGEAALGEVLAHADAYVWRSHHSFAYYESFRFRDALLAGALPSKIDPADHGAIPGVYASVTDLAEELRRADCERLFRAAVTYYEAQGPLAMHLREALNALS